MRKARPGLISRKGRKLDDAALAATEAGYIGRDGERGSIDDLLAGIDRELSGQRIYSRRDQQAALEAEAAQQAERDNEDMQRRRETAQALFDELGYNATPEQIDEAIMADVNGEATLQDAVDGIVMQEAMNHADSFQPAEADAGEFDIPFEPVEPVAGQAERPDAGRAGRTEDVQAGGRQDRGASTEKGAEGLDQFVLPGAEQSAKQAMKARDKKGGIRKGGDKPLEEGIFAPRPDERQTDVEEAARSAARRRPVINRVFNRNVTADLLPLIEFDLAQDKPKNVQAWAQEWVRKVGAERFPDRAVEVVAVLDGDKPVWSGTLDEDRAAPLDRDAVAGRSGLLIVHNHPRNGPLSALDVAQLWHGMFDGVVAVLQKSGEAWHAERAIDLPFGDETVRMIYRALNDADSAVKRIGQPWINEGRVTRDDMMQADQFWAMDAMVQAGLIRIVAGPKRNIPPTVAPFTKEIVDAGAAAIRNVLPYRPAGAVRVEPEVAATPRPTAQDAADSGRGAGAGAGSADAGGGTFADQFRALGRDTPDAWDNLRVSLIEQYPAQAAEILDAMDEAGGRPSDLPPVNPAEQEARKQERQQKGQRIIDYLAAGNEIVVPGARRGLLLNRSELVRLRGDGVQIAEGRSSKSPDGYRWVWLTDQQIDSMAAYASRSAVPAPASPEAAAPIEDFGEKIEGARKDMAAALQREFTDDELASLPLSKIWPTAEIDKMEDTYAAAVATTARAEIPAKPKKGYKVARWVDQVKTLRRLASMLLDGTITRENFEERAKQHRLEGFMAKVSLLEQVPRDQWKRIGKVAEYPNATEYKNGKPIPKPMTYVAIDGRTQSFAGGSVAEVVDAVNDALGAKTPSNAKIKFEVRGTEAKGFFINRKGDPEYRKLKTFATVKEAMAYRQEHYDELVAAWENVKERDNVKKADVRRSENLPRTGKDHRGGKDVSVEQFQEAFGFRGGQFGNWVKQGVNAKERQWMLNSAYDALMDLADIVGVPPKAISLDGQLGIAFGARGHGWASAHYEPTTMVINLTKTRGAGTLAHEWFHALDNYFQRRRGAGNTRETAFVTYAPEAYYEHPSGRRLPAKLFEKAANSPTIAAYDVAGDREKAKIRTAQRWIGDKAEWTKRDNVRLEVEERFAELVAALDASPMRQRAVAIDKGKEGYWSRIIERAARSFENYVIAKMAAQGYNNDYLANVVSADDFVRDPARYPYLKPEEMAPVVEAFDNLFNTIETRETDRGVAMFQLRSPAPWYFSPLTRAAENAKINTGSGAQWMATLQNTPGVKAEEIQWTGLPEFLGDRKGITREEVLAFLGNNGVQVRDVTLGGRPTQRDMVRPTDTAAAPFLDEWNRLNDEIRAARDEIDALQSSGPVDLAAQDVVVAEARGGWEVQSIAEPGSRWINKTFESKRTAETQAEDLARGKVEARNERVRVRAERRLRELEDQRDALHEKMVDATIEEMGGLGKATRYEDYTLPGGENYRELLLTLPPKPGAPGAYEVVQKANGTWVARRFDTGLVYGGFQATREAAQAKADEINAKAPSADSYRSSHFDESNILAHVRLNERTDTDGKRVLFIEEIQSDWHQAGRKKGYKTSELPTLPEGSRVFQPDPQRYPQAWVLQEPNVEFASPRFFADSEADARRIAAENYGKGRDAVPDAPFKKNWHELAFKRVLRLAAEGGFDRVAWTTGETQADRFDLSKQVREIEYIKHPDGYELGITALNGDGVDLPKNRYSLDELEGVVGKEIAQKIERGEGKKYRGHDGITLEGLDLKIGGEGMRGFYDKMLPTFANKLGKKYGASVGRTSIPVESREDVTESMFGPERGYDDLPDRLRQKVDERMAEADATAAHAIDITPQMRDMAMAGQPLFRVNPDVATKLPALERDLRARLTKLGISERVTLRLQERIQTAVNGKTVDANAMYLNGVITIALDGPDAMGSLNHEAIHALKELGLFTNLEWQALERAARADAPLFNRVRKLYDGMGLGEPKVVEEVIAEQYRMWAAGQSQAGGWMAKAFKKIRNFFQALGQALRGQGFTTPEMVFQRVESGAVGARGTTESTAFKKLSDFLGSPRMARGVLSSADQSVVDSLQSNAKALADLLEGEADGAKSRGLINIPRAVVPHVLRLGKHEQIRKAVVRLLPVDVVDYLASKKVSPESVLNDKAVLENVLSIDEKAPIPAPVDVAPATALVRAIARIGAELAGLTGRALESGAASFTKAGDAVSGGHASTISTKSAAFSSWFGKSKVVDANGEPLVVYHGTEGGDFDTFMPASYFSTNPKEAGAFASVGDIRNRERGLKKYTLVEAPADLDGARLPYAGILSDHYPAEVGKSYATDQGVFRYKGNGRWDAFSDLDVQYDEKTDDWDTIVVRKGTGKDAKDTVREQREFLERRFPGGEGGRVVPVYLSIQNPIRLGAIEANRLGLRLGGTREENARIIAKYEAQGYDGIITESDEALTFPEVATDLGGVPTHYIAFRPEQIKSVFNQGTFDPTDPRISYQLAGLAPGAQFDQRGALQDTMRALEGQTYSLFQRAFDPAQRGKIGHWLDRARFLFQDRMIFLRRAQEGVEELLGRPLRESERAYLSEELFAGRVGEQKQRLQWDYQQPLMEKMAEAELTVVEVDDYLYALHAEERNNQIARINPEMPDGGSGITTAEARAHLAAVPADKRPALEAIADLVHGMMEQRLDHLVESGLLSQRDADAMRQTYQNYVPLRGKKADPNEDVMDPLRPLTGRGYMGSRAKEKRATGRFSEAPDVLATAFILADEAIVRGEKNRVGQAVLELANAAPDPAVWKVNPAPRRAYIDKATGQVRYKSQPHYSSEDTMSVRVGGQEFRIQIMDPNLLASIKQIGGTQQNAMVQSVARVTQVLSKLNTMWNPEFVVANASRDMQTALVNLGMQEDAGALRKDVVRNWGRAFKGMHHYLRTGRADTQWSQYAQEFRQVGGQTAFNALTDVEQQKKTMERVLAELQGDKKAVPLKALRSLRDMVENANDAVDNAVRLGTFVALRERGVSPKRAASVAKNLTVNFNRRGSLGPTFNAFFMFFNAAVQGTAVLANAVRSPQVRKIVGAVAVMGAMQEIIGGLMPSDEEDDELGLNVYDRIPEWVKTRNMIIPYGPGAGDYIQLPMPYGYNFFHNLGRLMVGYLRGAPTQTGAPVSLGQTTAHLLRAFQESIMPPGLGDSAIGGVPVPSIVAPFVEVAVNEDWTGRAIMPERFPGDTRPDSQLAFNSVNPLSRVTAEFLNSITGGNAFRPGLVDVSPEGISHVVSSFSGAAGAQVLRAMSSISRGAGEALGWNERDPNLSILDVPFIRKVVGYDSPFLAREATYRRITEIETLKDEFDGAVENGDREAARAIRSQSGPLLAMMPAARSLRRELLDIRKQRQALSERENMTAAQKRERSDMLDEREKQLMRAFNARYLSALKRQADA